MKPSTAVVIPTRGRPAYLQTTLASIMPQARAAGAEVIVVDDGRLVENENLAADAGARYVALGIPQGLNIARNSGLHATDAALIIYVDDDVEVRVGWLDALLGAAADLPDVGVFTGPVHARFEGRELRTCGREGPPITFLDLGAEDCDTQRAWGVNLAIRRSAFDAVGEFDPRRSGGGDEEEWEERWIAAGGRIRYVAAAALDHRRSAADARLSALMRAAHARGRQVRRFDAEDGEAPPLRAELRVLAGCLWHVARRRCENGLVMAAHSAGRVRAVRERPAPTDDFLSGESGTVGGRRDVLRELADRALDVVTPRLGASAGEPRRVLVVSIVRERNRSTYERAAAQLRASRHTVELVTGPPGSRGKFENLDVLLGGRDLSAFDWLLVMDDDIALPDRFLDRFLGLSERFELVLAQPAHRLRSHAAWRLTRRHARSLVRETAFVEIGPLTAISATAFDTLLPFPRLRMGWGLDAHWAALAWERNWRLGVVDATPIAHLVAAVGDDYSREQALEEARSFLASHRYLPARESQRTLAVHRR